MTKETIIAKLNGIKRDILDYSYIDDWDGDDEDGALIRKVYNGMTEKDLRNILNRLQTVIYDIKESE